MSSKKNLWIIVIVLLVIVGLAIYLLSWGQINIIPDAEHANRQRRKEIENQLAILEPEMEKDIILKKKLDGFVLWGFIFAKVFLLVALFAICLVIKSLFRLSWTDLYEWKDKAGFCIAICGFILFGAEVKYFKSYPWMKALVKSWVYRKYGHLQKQIDDRIEKIKQLKDELATIPETPKKETPGSTDIPKS